MIRTRRATEKITPTDQAPALDGGERERIRPDPLPALTPAQIAKPSKSIETNSPPSVIALDVPVSGDEPDIAASIAARPSGRLRLVNTVQDDSSKDESPENSEADEGWEWDGRSWTVGDKAGSTYTQQFRLRVKDTDGVWHYVKSWTMSFE
ncbi:MAG: hypothetical protein ACREEM_24750, partial [Blastocatellia bacterium]